MISMAQRKYDRCAPPWDQWFLNGTDLDHGLAELAGGYESVQSETTRTIKRWGQEAASNEFQVRLKRE
jgi:hypothetical protein